MFQDTPVMKGAIWKLKLNFYSIICKAANFTIQALCSLSDESLHDTDACTDFPVYQLLPEAFPYFYYLIIDCRIVAHYCWVGGGLICIADNPLP